jgi:hypothetical protein
MTIKIEATIWTQSFFFFGVVSKSDQFSKLNAMRK